MKSIISNADFLPLTESLFNKHKIVKFTDLHDFLLAPYMYRQNTQGSALFEILHNYNTEVRLTPSRFSRDSYKLRSLYHLSFRKCGTRYHLYETLSNLI